MTMKMLMKEQLGLGETKKTVSVIRDMDISDIDMASKLLKVDVAYIKKVLSLISDNPEMDDEEIAEILIDSEN